MRDRLKNHLSAPMTQPQIKRKILPDENKLLNFTQISSAYIQMNRRIFEPNAMAYEAIQYLVNAHHTLAV